MGYETDIIRLENWILKSDRALDNTQLINLKADMERNNTRGLYDKQIEMINKKLGIDNSIK